MQQVRVATWKSQSQFGAYFALAHGAMHATRPVSVLPSRCSAVGKSGARQGSAAVQAVAWWPRPSCPGWLTRPRLETCSTEPRSTRTCLSPPTRGCSSGTTCSLRLSSRSSEATARKNQRQSHLPGACQPPASSATLSQCDTTVLHHRTGGSLQAQSVSFQRTICHWSFACVSWRKPPASCGRP